MLENKKLRSTDDNSLGKPGAISLDIVCAVCNDTRGTVNLVFTSDKDKGLFRAICICENCQGTPKAIKILDQYNKQLSD